MVQKKTIHKRLLISIVVLFLGVVTAAFAILFAYQDKIVQNLVTGLNDDFKGALIIEDTDIKPFANFPYTVSNPPVIVIFSFS